MDSALARYEGGLMTIYVLVLTFLVLRLLGVYLKRCWRSLAARIAQGSGGGGGEIQQQSGSDKKFK